MVNHVIPVVLTSENFDFDAQEPNGDIAEEETGVADGVFFGGDDPFDIAFEAALVKGRDFAVGEAVVIREAFGKEEFGTEFDERVFESFGNSDARQRGDVFSLQGIER